MTCYSLFLSLYILPDVLLDLYTPSIYILLVYVGLPANFELSHVQFRNKIARYSSLSYLTLTARE